jgi:nucleotide-binding universal stress UspA family protein
VAERGEESGAGLPELRSVLAPTDFSECGRAAIPYAYGVVARGGCVHLLHVIEPHPTPNPLYAHYTPGRTPTPEERARQEADLHAKLEALVPPAAKARGVRTAVELVEGRDVAQLVCELADRIDADAICIGTHGRSGLARAVLGSVAEKVLRHTRRAVMLVRLPGE